MIFAVWPALVTAIDKVGEHLQAVLSFGIRVKVNHLYAIRQTCDEVLKFYPEEGNQNAKQAVFLWRSMKFRVTVIVTTS